MWLLLTACSRSVPLGDDSVPPPEATLARWGDLHAHSGFSPDACEDPGRECAPDGDQPARAFFARAAANGLAFAALTDHAEVVGWTDLENEVSVDIWAATTERIAEADGGPVVPVAGYEWTAARSEGEHDLGGHRTVLFEDPAPCAAWRVPGGTAVDTKRRFGHEAYTLSDVPPVETREAFEAALAAAPGVEGCVATRWLSFLHHPAVSPPQAVDWTRPDVVAPDERLVEIYSEHGASECADTTAVGCTFALPEDRYVPTGSVQAALSAGARVGFLAGTDGHDGDPGSLPNGPSTTAFLGDTDGDGEADDPLPQFTHGGVTGVLTAEPTFDRAALFDALLARHTVAASWAFPRVAIAVRGADGTDWLPGDGVPISASPLTVQVDLGGADADGVVVDADGATEPFEGTVTLTTGDVRYLRFDVHVDGAVERLWLSPFFAE